MLVFLQILKPDRNSWEFSLNQILINDCSLLFSFVFDTEHLCDIEQMIVHQEVSDTLVLSSNVEGFGALDSVRNRCLFVESALYQLVERLGHLACVLLSLEVVLLDEMVLQVGQDGVKKDTDFFINLRLIHLGIKHVHVSLVWKVLVISWNCLLLQEN